jgi:hypothetical protein
LPWFLALQSEGTMRPRTANEGRIDSKKRRTIVKTMRATQNPTSLKLLLGVLIATCVFSAAANAQPSFVGKFTLPYEVHWDSAVLPAGEYSIRMDSVAAPAVIRWASGSREVYTRFRIIADSEKGGACLTITVNGNERRVRSLNLPELGESVIFAPLTKTEREMLAKASQIDTLPVVTAKK